MPEPISTNTYNEPMRAALIAAREAANAGDVPVGAVPARFTR